MKLTVHKFVSLDDVIHGPGGPNEDTRDGFDLGGWQVPFIGAAILPVAFRRGPISVVTALACKVRFD